MQKILGLVCVLFGAIGWIGQTISAINFPLAQKLGFQEKSEDTDPLYRIAELNAARWDAVVLWSIIAAGILLLIDHTWWPYVSLVASAVYLDTAGREAAKYLSFLKGGIKTGTAKEKRTAFCFFGIMAIISLWLMVYAACSL